MSTINKFEMSTNTEDERAGTIDYSLCQLDERTVKQVYQKPKHGGAWSLDDLKRGSIHDEPEEETRTVGRPKTRKVPMTRRPMTATFGGRAAPMTAVFDESSATFDGVPLKKVASRSPHRTSQPSSDVNVGAPASVHVSTARQLCRTRQPSSDASVGAAASGHIGAALRPSEHFTPLELELMEMLMRARNENKRLQRAMGVRNNQHSTMRRVRS